MLRSCCNTEWSKTLSITTPDWSPLSLYTTLNSRISCVKCDAVPFDKFAPFQPIQKGKYTPDTSRSKTRNREQIQTPSTKTLRQRTSISPAGRASSNSISHFVTASLSILAVHSKIKFGKKSKKKLKKNVIAKNDDRISGGVWDCNQLTLARMEIPNAHLPDCDSRRNYSVINIIMATG